MIGGDEGERERKVEWEWGRSQSSEFGGKRKQRGSLYESQARSHHHTV